MTDLVFAFFKISGNYQYWFPQIKGGYGTLIF